MADKKKGNNKGKGAYGELAKSFFGDELNRELRELIDLAVRRQFDAQQFVERFANTHYFRQKFPGIIEGGALSEGLTGAHNLQVNSNTLTQAIAAYNKGFTAFQDIGSKYGVKVSKDMFSSSLKAQTSATEFQQRLQAIDTVDSNPALLAAFEQQAKAQGFKATKESAYRAAARAGDAKFQNIYEAAQYDVNLGFGPKEARDLAKGPGGATGGATFESIDQVIAAARENLQSLSPELAARGINPAKLVKVLNNPTAYTGEVQTIKDLLGQRQSLHGQPVVGTYAQEGSGGGLSQYPQEAQAAYG